MYHSLQTGDSFNSTKTIYSLREANTYYILLLLHTGKKKKYEGNLSMRTQKTVRKGDNRKNLLELQ